MKLLTRTAIACVAAGLVWGPSGPAMAEAPAAEAPDWLRHVPPAEAEPGQSIELLALLPDAWQQSAVARYRPVGAGEFVEAPFELSSTGEHVAVIPADAVRAPGVSYYIAVIDGDQQPTTAFASAERPHTIRVDPPASQRWKALERQRLGGRVNRVRSAVTGQSFGPDGDAADYYLRGEIDLTHRLVTALYSVTVGFGFLDGTTPSQGATVAEQDRQTRYGYGGARLRLRDKVWLDGHALMGFDTDGFIAGVGGQLTLGNDWRSCVQLGFEVAGGMGPSAWVRLQWDTAPPLLMGATAIKTDLPDADRSDGSAVRYDVSYAVSDAMRLTGAVSFGARGRRAGGIGGSLGVSVDF